MKKLVLIILLIPGILDANGQEKTFAVFGKVIDSASKQPLPSTSVFCQNTTYGTLSNSEGKFFMRLPNGGYDLVVSYTGYERKVLRISNTMSNIDTIVIELTQQDRALTEVAVVGTSEVADGWVRFGKFFTDHFIGTTPNAAECIISNPETLRFFYSKKRGRLKVTAKEDVLILNNALGYRIRFQLDSFSYDYNTNISQYTGFPFFQEIDTLDEVKSKWNKNRTRTYLGSRLHFMHSLYTSSISEEGFIVEQMDENPQSTKGTVLKNLYDSSIYVADSNTVEVLWNGRYRVSFKPVLPDKKFLEEFNLPANSRMQVTLLEISDGFVVEKNGYFYEQYDVINLGYWAWKKLGEALPNDYRDRDSK